MAAFVWVDREPVIPQVDVAARSCFWTGELSGRMPDLPPAFAGFGPRAELDELRRIQPSRACPASRLAQTAGDS